MKNKLIALLIPILIISINSSVFCQKSTYRESVDIHLGRSTFISGEILFYKAYCSASQDRNVQVLSKVVYAELINNKGQSVINQILEIKDGWASSMIIIPDTLSTGMYKLTGYTQWMRNAGKKEFYSEPVFIYNQYDENAPYALSNYSMPIEPEFYFEGEKLLANTENTMIIKVPGLFGKELPGMIGQWEGDTLGQSFTIGPDGNAIIYFKPQINTSYKLILGDAFYGKKIFDLPPVSYSGYIIHPISAISNSLIISLLKCNMPDESLKLEAWSGSSKLTEISIPKGKSENSYSIPLDKFDTPSVNLKLINSTGILLCDQAILLESKSQPVANLSITKYPPHGKIELTLLPENLYGTSYSISVYKKNNKDDEFKVSEVYVRTNYANLKLQGIFSVIPRYIDSKEKEKSTHAGCFSLCPVEDLGIILSGKVINTFDNLPVEGVEIILAVKDTLASIHSGKTDSKGCFALLLKSYGNKTGNIILKKEGVVLGQNYKVLLDEKSDFLSMAPSVSLQLSNDYAFVTQMKDEAQRALIQRAFHSNNEGANVIQSDKPGVLQTFYGKAQITVYPGNYISLPNFEEISREVLPRVKYRKNKVGCEVFVTDIENNLRSESPIVLLDGVPVISSCDLFPLNSEDIRKVEIQSGVRVSGNYLYNGLVAIFTSDNYRTKKKEADERNTYYIPGYVNSELSFSIPEASQKSSASGIPDFRNQLFWNPDLQITEDSSVVSFYTSDEEGEYLIDILGYTNEGYPVSFQQAFTVYDH
jgi:hypothetical protein